MPTIGRAHSKYLNLFFPPNYTLRNLPFLPKKSISQSSVNATYPFGY